MRRCTVELVRQPRCRRQSLCRTKSEFCELELEGKDAGVYSGAGLVKPHFARIRAAQLASSQENNLLNEALRWKSEDMENILNEVRRERDEVRKENEDLKNRITHLERQVTDMHTAIRADAVKQTAAEGNAISSARIKGERLRNEVEAVHRTLYVANRFPEATKLAEAICFLLESVVASISIATPKSDD